MTRSLSAAVQYDGPWLTGPPAQRLPTIHRDFDRNRDPLIARQMDAQAKTEAQRREDSAASGHRIPADPPRPALKPKSARGDWLAAEREAAFANKAPEQAFRSARTPSNDQTPQTAQETTPTGPTR